MFSIDSIINSGKAEAKCCFQCEEPRLTSASYSPWSTGLHNLPALCKKNPQKTDLSVPFIWITTVVSVLKLISKTKRQILDFGKWQGTTRWLWMWTCAFFMKREVQQDIIAFHPVSWRFLLLWFWFVQFKWYSSTEECRLILVGRVEGQRQMRA